MGFDKMKMRQIRSLILLVAVLTVVILYSGGVWAALCVIIGFLKPFIIGGAIAFVLNIILRLLEDRLLKRWNGKVAAKIKRPLCILLSILLIVAVVVLVIQTVVPQLTKTVKELGVAIPPFINEVLAQLEVWLAGYPELTDQLTKLQKMEFDWQSLLNSTIDFLKNGMGNVLTSTVTVASGIVGGVINTFIAVIFAFYILSQKEKLEDQGRRILSAYLPERVENKILKVLALLAKNFSSFISGQCLEACILGALFIIAMTIFGFPYAVMVGVLIAFTALIPIVGAFIGCFVGAFLICIHDPIQALWFIVLFLVLQQIEGNLIYPKVVGSSVGLPSIWVLVAVSIGGSLFGIPGILCFIPLVSTCYALLRENVNVRNADKDAENDAGRDTQEAAEKNAEELSSEQSSETEKNEEH